MTESSKPKPKRYQFKAEVKQLLDILVHSVYTSQDIFIRELISNASDALEKVRFMKVRGDVVADPDCAEVIGIETSGEDDEQKTLTITDTGIGMTADELRANLGTIAHSGATAFLEQLESQAGKQDLSLIGRFGIGFYSVFMAADEVVLTTRSADPEAEPMVWRSNGLGSYSILPAPADTPRGTRIEIHVKKDCERFAEDYTVRSAVTRYSNFIPFPISLGGEQINQTTALWREQPGQIEEEKYNEFFKFIAYDSQDPLLRLHQSVDVPLQYSALLFVPKSNNEAMGFGEGKVSLHLYVKRVLIDGECEDLLPRYLRFVKGVVESEDLPLSISREMLQENKYVVKIRETLTRKLLGEFQKLADEKPEEYADFWRAFGRILKEGYSDFSNAEKLHELLRFNSSHHEDGKGLCGLASYLERMPESQKEIYYLTGATRESLERDPRLELFRKKGIEVFYLSDAADEFVLGGVGTYKEKRLVSADQVKPESLKEVEPGDAAKDDEPESPAASTEEMEPLIARFKEILGGRVTDVRSSERLVDSPACLVNEEGMSSHMDKVMRLMSKESELPKRTLELNPSHALIGDLASLVKKDSADPFVARACEQIFEASMLADGYLTDPHRFVERMNDILGDAAAARAGK